MGGKIDKTNRFAIVNYYENILDAIENVLLKNSYSKDKFTKSLQKSFHKRLNSNYNIETISILKSRMIQDIKNIFKKFFSTEDIIVLNIRKNLDNIILPYIYSKNKQISFKTNDPNLFCFIPEVEDPDYNIININKNSYSTKLNNIFYIDNLDKIRSINIIKNNNFIMDLKSDFHNINQIRIVSFKENNLNDDEFDIYTIFKTWSTLLYLNIDGIINNKVN